jgi:hypothetical protein
VQVGPGVGQVATTGSPGPGARASSPHPPGAPSAKHASAGTLAAKKPASPMSAANRTIVQSTGWPPARAAPTSSAQPSTTEGASSQNGPSGSV